MIDEDLMYDRWVDTIICSEDFVKCENRDDNGSCLESKDKNRCWHLSKCPMGKRRV
jgi:hypothetical protein